jgi:hypothetical protein
MVFPVGYMLSDDRFSFRTAVSWQVDDGPHDDIVPVQINTHGHVVRPGLGLTLLSQDQAISRIGPDAGVIMKDILPGPESGASIAGVR